MDEFAAHIEVLLEDEDAAAEVARPDRRRQAGGAATDHDDIGVVVPRGFFMRRRGRRAGQRNSTRAGGGGGTLLEEFAPAQVLELVTHIVAVLIFLGHSNSSCGQALPAALINRTVRLLLPWGPLLRSSRFGGRQYVS
jgi:hypothetical protein